MCSRVRTHLVEAAVVMLSLDGAYKVLKPVFIDTLSFEKYVQGSPWTPHKQFCQHFYGLLGLLRRYGGLSAAENCEGR